MKIVLKPDEFRGRNRDILYKLLKHKKKSKHIEVSIYNKSIREATERHVVKKWNNGNFTQIYINNFRSMYFNLKKKSHVKNNYLFDQIKKNKIDAKKVGEMKHQELFPERWKVLIENKIKRDKNFNQVDLSFFHDKELLIKVKNYLNPFVNF